MSKVEDDITNKRYHKINLKKWLKKIKIIRKPETVFDMSQLVRLRRLDLKKKHEVNDKVWYKHYWSISNKYSIII